MVDIDEIMKRAQAASEQAAETMKKSFEKSEEIARSIKASAVEAEDSAAASEADEQMDADAQRQVEILGQLFSADSMGQLFGADSMEQLFGEDMGIIAAALETLGIFLK